MTLSPSAVTEALDVWIPEYAEVLAQRDDMQMEPLEVVRDAARWALALLEGLDYEAAARAMYDKDDAYLEKWEHQTDDVKAWYRQMTRYAVDAAIPGLGKLPRVVRQGELD